MERKHFQVIFLAVSCLLLLAVIYIKNKNTSSKAVTLKTNQSENKVDWEYLKGIYGQDVPETIAKLDSLFVSHNMQKTDTVYLSDAIKFFDKNNFRLPAARFSVILAEVSNSSENWFAAAEKLYFNAINERDSLVRAFLMRETMRSCDAIIKKDSQNTEAILFKGLALVDQRSTMMEGVPLLLSVVRKDENNIPANYALGLLAVESGQFEKALLRFEKLVSLQPLNSEYQFQCAKAHETLGNKEKALQHYQKSMELVSDERDKEILKNIINGLK